ncbi:MAG TPA: DUF2147 domain-containing protein [Rhabdochlamydiaceae bacterium]
MRKILYVIPLFMFFATAMAGNINSSSGFLFSKPLDVVEEFFRFFRSPIAEESLEAEVPEESCQTIAESEETVPNDKSIVGFWETLNQNTGKPQGLVAIYEYQGAYYGRLIASYDAEGKISDSIYTPMERAPGIRGNPYYCGLDFVWNLRPAGSRYKGKIIDPRKGNVYDAEVWRRGNNLILRGKVLMFGKNLTWPPAAHSVFSPHFKMPNVGTFVPTRPRVN